MNYLEKIKERLFDLHPYNVTVTESPLGSEWVRLRLYDCLGFFPDKVQDFRADEMWAEIELCQTEDDVTNIIFQLDEFVTAEPAFEERT